MMACRYGSLALYSPSPDQRGLSEPGGGGKESAGLDGQEDPNHVRREEGQAASSLVSQVREVSACHQIHITTGSRFRGFHTCTPVALPARPRTSTL